MNDIKRVHQQLFILIEVSLDRPAHQTFQRCFRIDRMLPRMTELDLGPEREPFWISCQSNLGGAWAMNGVADD
jgi:hypothetical protein